MVETQAKEKPFCFQTPAEQALGLLRIGRRSFSVEVSGYSWAGYTIHVPPKTAQRLRSGTTGRLSHAGSTYEVSCGSQEQLDGKVVQVELLRELDPEEVRRQKRKRAAVHAPAAHTLSQRDPVLSFATWMFLIMLLMILPGWGEVWEPATTSPKASALYSSTFVMLARRSPVSEQG